MHVFFFTIQVIIAYSYSYSYIVRPDLTTNSGEISESLHFITAPPLDFTDKIPTLLSIVTVRQIQLTFVRD
jgi:hypothetical protein